MENYEEKVEDLEIDEEWGLEAPASPMTNLASWCKKNATTLISVGCTILGFIGNCIFSTATKRGVDDYLYTEVEDDIYRIPVKKMKTSKKEKELHKKKL